MEPLLFYFIHVSQIELMEKVLARFPNLTLTALKSLLNDEDVNCAASKIVSLLNIDLNIAHFTLAQV